MLTLSAIAVTSSESSSVFDCDCGEVRSKCTLEVLFLAYF